MKKRINLIVSITSLVVTTALLIVSMFAWYAVNQVANASNIFAATEGIKGSFKLYYFEDTSTEDDGVVTKSGSWIESNNSLKINDAFPGDVFYFKIVGSQLEEGQTLNIKFSNIQSSINKEAVTGEKIGDDYIINYEGQETYKSSSTTFNVTYKNASNVSVTKTLYQLSQEEDSSEYTVGLKDIKIQDAFKVYTNPTLESAGGLTDFPKSKGTTKVNVDQTIAHTAITASDNGTKTVYFALSFDSQDIYDGDNNLITNYDNYYMYQGLNVKNISINAV